MVSRYLFITLTLLLCGQAMSADHSASKNRLNPQDILYLRQLLSERLQGKGVKEDEREIIIGARRRLQGLSPAPSTTEKRGELEDRLKNVLRQTVARNPKRPSSREDLARFYLYLDSPDKALRHLKLAGPLGDRELFRPLLMAYSTLRLGENEQAENYIQRVEQAVQELLPLRIQQARFCTQVGGMGQYSARADTPMRPEEITWVYFELVGGAFRSSKDGAFQLDVAIGLAIRDELQRTLWEKREYCDFPPVYQHRVPIVFGGMDFVVPKDLKAGKYSLMLICRDRVSGKEAETPIHFTVE